MKIKLSVTFHVQAACTLLIIFSVARTHAQEPAQQPVEAPKNPSPATGSVTGFVYSAETGLPMRFAQVLLAPRPSDAELARTDEQTNRSQTGQPQLQSVVGASGMDGSFHLDGVPVGDYFAGALMAGHVATGMEADADASADQLKHLIASMPTIHVAAGRVSSLNLSLHRGAVIAGRVQFGDGSLGVGLTVLWELVKMDLSIDAVRLAWPTPLQETMQGFDYYTQHQHAAITDDEGRFRISGLRPGKYILDTIIASQFGSAQVRMNDGSSPNVSGRNRAYPNMTTVYSPGVYRRKEAKVFDIRGDEQVTNADMIVDPNGLHTVKGRIVAGEDRHVPSQALIRLREDGKDTGRLVMIEDDGSFEIDYVPPGTYTLEVNGAPDMTAPASAMDVPQVSRRYKVAELGVIVGEHDVVLDDVILVPLKPGEKEE